MATYGKIGEFRESDESWTQYIERLEQYFLANDVEDAAKQRAILLSVCGSKTYALLRDLLQPARPAETTFKKIVDTLEKHFSPKPSEIVERFKFHSRNRNEGEGVAAYVAELRKLTEHCNFGETLPEMLRDRLVCGINDKKIQRRLLAERELTLKKAEEIALGEELAAKHVVDIQSEPTPSKVHQVGARDKNYKDRRADSECHRCGEKHEASACRFKDAQCFKCGRKGHLSKVCYGEKNYKKKPSKGTDSRKTKPPSRDSWQTKGNQKQSTHLVDEVSREEDVYAATMYHIRDGRKPKAFEVSVELCGEPHNFEIDTGATRTVLNEQTYSKLGDKVELKNSNAILSTYTGEKIPVLGEVLIPVKYQNQQHDLPAMVVKGPGPNLLGRDWLQVIKFNWNSIFNVQENNPQLQKVLDAHKNVFGEGLGTLKGTEAKIYVDPGATPKFMKARPVPYALKAKVEQELERLRSEGIISPVEFTEWAAPIVPVVKQDGSVRICGDYKCTVNQVSKLDNYPIPKTEDLLATLGGGNKFTKLDMSQAYQQLLLDEESKKF
ncbi:hypothetical protein ACROYT_G007595, partial [Oculina patagonica]